MPVYQPHQRFRYQKEERGSKFGRILVIIVIIIVLFFIGRGLFGGKKSSENTNNTNTESISVANIIAQINENANANINVNASANTNKVPSGPFSIETCAKTYSRGVDKKQIALTFNVGTAKEGEVQKVLDILKNQSATASFFARGDVAEQNPDLINKIDQAGFPIYNLSYNYPHFNDLPESGIREQLQKAEKAISQCTEKSTKPFFRPPFGEIDNDVFKIVKEEGYCPITWTVDALDWSIEMTADESKERVLSKAANGAIVLMQASNSITAEILPSLITEIKARGFSLVDLKTLLSE